MFPYRSQEGVEEQFRGTVGGVQDSLNSIMETIKFLLVIILPDENSFGYLVLASVATVLLGSLFYLVYAARNWHGTKLPKGSSGPGSDLGPLLEDCDSDSDFFESAPLIDPTRDPKREVDFQPTVAPYSQ